MMWLILMLVMLAIAGLGFAYVVKRIRRFSFIGSRFTKKQSYFASIGILLAVLVLVFLWGQIWNTAVFFIHLLVFWMLADVIFWLIQRISKKKFKCYWAGITAIMITVVYFGIGIFCAYHVFRTEYQIDVEPELGVSEFRIVGFSDSHMGTTFHADKWPEYVEAMNRENPDIVVIAGDFVDDESSYEDMVKSCEALADLKTNYGVYFVFGNHDCGYYRQRRGYGKEELVENLEKNNIIVLEDKVVPLAGNIVLCGRQDSQQRSRKTMEDLSEEYEPDNCVIVLDHEPNDYDAEAASGADLVISGHTHGGQMIPINKAGEWMKLNDMTYGRDRRERTNFIVSSGISDWAFKIKTGCISEYLVIDLK